MASCADAANLKPFVVGAINSIQEHEDFYEQWLLREALLRHGYELEIRFFPGKRLMVELNNGNVDGDMLRVMDLSRGFDQVVRVDARFSQSCGWVYQLTDNDIANEAKKRVGLYRGTPGGNATISRIMPDAEIVHFSTLEQGAKQLANGRVDYVALIARQVEGFKLLVRRPITPKTKVALPFSYTHFHRRHAQLAKDIVPTILELQQQRPIPLCHIEAHLKAD